MSYQQPGGYPNAPSGNYPGPGGPPQGNGLAIAALVCGIVGVLIANIILGPLAIIFGGVGLSRANRGAPHHGKAVAGIVLGIVDIVIFVVLIAVSSNNGGYFYFHTS